MTLGGDKRRGGNFVLHLPYPDLTSKLYFLNSSYGLLQAQLSWGRLVSPLVPGLRKPEQLCVSLSTCFFGIVHIVAERLSGDTPYVSVHLFSMVSFTSLGRNSSPHFITHKTISHICDVEKT